MPDEIRKETTGSGSQVQGDRLVEAIVAWKAQEEPPSPYFESGMDRFVDDLIARVEKLERLVASAEASIQAAFEDGPNRAAELLERRIVALTALAELTPMGSGADLLIKELKGHAAAILALKEKPDA